MKHEQIGLYLDKMLDEMERIAKNNRASICFLNVTGSEIQLMGILLSRGYYRSMTCPQVLLMLNGHHSKDIKNIYSGNILI